MATAGRPNIPRAKREGLELDLEAVCARGVAALQPDDHYRLKTYGVCAQRQDDLFMIRLRIPGGRLAAHQVGAIAAAARAHAGGWVHLTTRQNVELHSVTLESVPDLYARLEPAGVVGRSACGHTIRNIVACPGASTALDEPFDVGPDARRLSDLLVARSAALNAALPSRLNIALGGCTSCGQEALVNDIGLVAVLKNRVPGYQLWAGGSLGTSPRLSVLLRPFIARHEVWPAVQALIDWFCTEGDVETIARGRLKFLIEDRGEAAFRQGFSTRFKTFSNDDQPPLADVLVPADASVAQAVANAPAGGWHDDVRPERVPGYASITVRLPLGDLLADELEALIAIAPTGSLQLTSAQNVVLQSVPVRSVARVLGDLAELRLGPSGARGQVDVRACPGLAFCSLAITGSQPVALAIERAVSNRPDLPRDATIAVSGCPNSCAKQQVADIGLAGGKVKVSGTIGLGYVLSLGANLASGRVGEPVLRVLEDEVPAAVVAVLETWVALRRSGEPIGATFERAGVHDVASAVAHRLRPDADRMFAGSAA